jgi:large subunit ribosomal protein L3
MTLGLLGTKIKMSQIYDNLGNLIPITIIKGGPCYITKIYYKHLNNFNSIQLGYIKLIKKNNLKKSKLNYFNNFQLPIYLYLKEYKTNLNKYFFINQQITLNIFKITEKINIQSISIGKGYTGNIKKHSFSRGPESHGSKHHRLQGSLGAGTDPARVFPGKKMSGKFGNYTCTHKNLEIININLLNNIIFIKGSISGKKYNLINLLKITNKYYDK